MLTDFKTVRDVHRTQQLRLNQRDRLREASAKQTKQQRIHLYSDYSAPILSASHPRTNTHGLLSERDVNEATELVHFPPVLDQKPSSSSASEYVSCAAREVLLVDLPIRKHKKTLSSTFEFVSFPRVIALPDCADEIRIGNDHIAVSKTDKFDEDWEAVDDFKPEQPPMRSYAQVITGTA